MGSGFSPFKIIRGIFFLILLFFLLVQMSQKVSASEEKVFLYIDTTVGDVRGGGDRDSDIGYVIMDLEKEYPDSTHLLVRGASNQEISNRLKSILYDRNIVISGLYVQSHGNVNIIGNESRKFFVNFNSDSSFKKAFSPLKGRFGLGAKLVFSGCSLLKGKTRKEALEFLLKVARKFGLKEGSIYMNRNSGLASMRSAFGQPVYAGGSTVTRILRGGLQLLTGFVPIMPLGMYAMDNLIFNKGYTLKISSTEAVLYRDHFFNALTEEASLEERELEGESGAGILLKRTLGATKDLLTPYGNLLRGQGLHY